MFLLLSLVLQSSPRLLATVPSSLYPLFRVPTKMTPKRLSKVQINHTDTLSVGEGFSMGLVQFNVFSVVL